MNLATEIPEYLSLSQYEKGTSLGLSPQVYSALAKSATSIIKAFPSLLAVYVKKGKQVCLLDVFPEGRDCCLTIHMDSKEGELRLFTAQMDSPDLPTCLLDTVNSKERFEQLQEIAKSYLSVEA